MTIDRCYIVCQTHLRGSTLFKQQQQTAAAAEIVAANRKEKYSETFSFNFDQTEVCKRSFGLNNVNKV